MSLPDKYRKHTGGCKYTRHPNYASCVECQKKYKMPHPYCCLDECGGLGFCSRCNKGIYMKDGFFGKGGVP